MVSSDLLSVTLALTLVSFIATLYVIVRTLTPLVGPHILSRYSRPTNPLPVFGYASPAPGKIQLRSAQRFQCWLAVVDLASSAVWLWEVISLANNSPSSPARMACAICARPTILLVVSLLSYLNVIRGKVVDLGRFDFIVWIPSLVLLAIMISLAYVAPATSSTVWQVMMAVETALLSICSLCFGRLLLAVFRVRRDTVRSHMIRHRMMLEEKAAEQERAAEQKEEEDARPVIPDAPPFLPPMKTNRWLISKTFLLKKASSAANTVHTSMHRRSQSGAATLAGRPSTASELPRASFASSRGRGAAVDNDRNMPYSFLNHDPATTSRFGHFRAQSNSQAESQQHHSHLTSDCPSSGVVITPRAVSFDLDTAARSASPAPPLHETRFGTLSRMTDFSKISIDQPRPSMGSYMSYDSTSSESGVAGYLSSGKLAYQNGRNGRNNNNNNIGLSRKEARKAGARMGGHLLNCIATWTLILPFLVYKMHQPTRPAPLYASILVALGLSLSGPLLAIQTIIAEGGLWYAKSVPPLMASSSAVAFEHLNSRGGTPTPNMTLLPPTSLTQPNSASTDITQATAQSTITSTATSSHRSSSSNDSVSSLASIAAFSNPAPGTFRHSLDTQDAPSTMLGRALAMAAPYPKLQIMKNKGVRDSHNIENIDVENGLPGDPELRKRESRKLKSYSMSRYSVISQHSIRSQEQQRGRKRSNTLGMSSGLEKSWEDVENAGEFGLRTPHRRRSALAIKDANSLTAAILAEKKRTPPRSPSVSSFTFRSSQGTSAHERRRSAPITPSSYKTVDESGILVSRYTDASSYNIDSLTASLLTSMLPGMRISTSALSTSDKRNSLHRSMSRDTTDDHREVTNTTATKSRPNLSLDISAKDSTFAKCDETSVGDSRQYSNGSPTEYLAKAKASGNDSQKPQQSRQGQHLRRRSRKSISYALPDDDELDHQTKKANHLPIDATNITTRRGGKSRLTPAVEEREEKVALPPAPRPSLEESYEVVDQHPIGDDSGLEVLSENKPVDFTSACAADNPASAGPPSIIIRTKTSATSQSEDNDDEIGKVTMATRIARTPSVSSFMSDGVLRPLSTTLTEDNANRSRSSTLGSITSEGFRNMIQSNRSSWTGSELGNESISAMLERQGALADAIVSPATSPRTAHPLQVRDKNLSNGKDLTETEDEKNNVTSTQGVGLTGIARANQAAQSRGGSMLASSRVHLTEARQQRMSQSYNNDENIESASRDATSRPGQQRSQVGSAAQTRLPRLANQRSIMSLR